MHSSLQRFDTSAASLVSHLPQWLTPFMKAASIIGLPIIIICLAVVFTATSMVNGSPAFAYAGIASLVALGGNTFIKYAVRRDRPQTIYAGNMRIRSYSFPSGHAFGSAVFYGLLAYVAYLHLAHPWNALLAYLAVLVITLVGISRIYLGAHFPSDVLIGWLLGGLSLLIIIELMRL